MDTFSASTAITIQGSPSKVWEALTDPTIIRSYLFGTDTKTDWAVGHPITWSGNWNGKEYEDKGTVLKNEPEKILSTSHWSPLSGNPDDPENYHIVTYELISTPDHVTLTVTQSNSPTQAEADEMIEAGWKPILEEIKKIVEDA